MICSPRALVHSTHYTYLITLLADVPLTLSFAGVDVATFTLPGLQASGGQTYDLSYSLPVSILSLPAFDVFGLALLNSVSLVFSLTGTATVTADLAGLKYKVIILIHALQARCYLPSRKRAHQVELPMPVFPVHTQLM